MIGSFKSKLPFDPHWTEKEYNPGGSRDDLGIETLGESILSDLLPGINNQTRRARYYSFWAWVLRDFINDPDTKHTQSNLYAWLRRREAALIFANLSHDCGGAAGAYCQGSTWRPAFRLSSDQSLLALLSSALYVGSLPSSVPFGVGLWWVMPSRFRS